ncbi:MAG: aminotransferase class I/II-fold pyridoxal phosphate-dependent enzyme [Candidatus Gracilibacteria bacterium]
MYDKINSKVQKYSNKKYSFITGNGTSAIYLALKASGIKKGSLIAVPNISCPDPVYALIWAGYKPVFIDINEDDYNMDVNHLEEVLQTQNIKGIIAIHLFGNSCDIVNIQKLSKKYNCFLVEDSAQAFGNEIDEGKLGSFGDVSIFSFGNGKIIEAGYGGGNANKQ